MCVEFLNYFRVTFFSPVLSDILQLAGFLYFLLLGPKESNKEKSPLWEISGKNFEHAEKYGVSVFRRKAVKQKPDPYFSVACSRFSCPEISQGGNKLFKRFFAISLFRFLIASRVSRYVLRPRWGHMLVETGRQANITPAP